MFYSKANESRENLLPTYEDVTELTTRSAEPPISENLPEIDKIFERMTKAGDVIETFIRSHVLTHIPESLESFLRAQNDAVSSAVVRIRGTHSSKTRPTGVQVPIIMQNKPGTPWLWEEMDFDITVKVIPNGWKTYRGTRTKTDGMNYHAEVVRPELSVMEWCRDFCAYRYGPKVFEFSSRITDIDQLIPIDAIKKTLQDIKYAGNIKIGMEKELRRTTLISDHLLNRFSDSGLLYFFCAVALSGIVMLPFFNWLLTKRWHVIMINWPASFPQDPEAASAATGEADGEGWADKWELAIARAALGRMTGELGSAVLDAEGRPPKALGDFGEVRSSGANE